MGQKERNKATEVVDGVVETVDVSKHPTASIEPSDLSLADIERRKSHPVRWILFMALVLLAMIAPYWWGRDIAVRDASWMVANLNFLDPKGVALISWTVTIVALTGLGLMVADAKKWLWGTIFVIGLAAEQFVAGMCLLSFNFWNATYVMYGEAAGLGDAAELIAGHHPTGDRREFRHHRRRFRCRGLRGALGGPAGVHQEGIEAQRPHTQLGLVPIVLRNRTRRACRGVVRRSAHVHGVT